MEGFIFAAWVYCSGIDQGREHLIEIELEICGEFEIIHVFFHLKLCKDCFQREVPKGKKRGMIGDFADTAFGMLSI